MPVMTPTIGRIVHYFAPGSEKPLAAMVTAADNMIATLTVFPPGGAPFVAPSVSAVGGTTGRWAWPPRV